MTRLIAKFILIVLLVCPMPALAQIETGKGSVTGLDVPRLVSLRTDKVYVRSGPGMRYPIQWIYKKRDLPVMITREFGTWRRVSDFEGGEGWVHQSLLSSRRFGLVLEGPEMVYLHRKPDNKSAKRARIEPGVIVRFEEEDQPCKDGWCRVAADSFKGWVEEKTLWGVDVPNESDKSDQ